MHLYEQRHTIEKLFGKLKGWRRITMRYDHRPHSFFSVIYLATTITVLVAAKIPAPNA